MMLLRLSLVMLLATAGSSCVVQSVCYNDADCPVGKYCNAGEGRCVPFCQVDPDCQTGQFCADDHTCREAGCFRDEDCNPGYKCEDHECRASGTLACPDDMLAIDNRFCIDKYEASRPDASDISSGTSNAMATSRHGVLPWMVENNAEALAACQAADKTLCTEKQWGDACRGPAGTVYGYGDQYDPEICNGIDKYCYCNGTECADEDPCPFPHCYHTCGASFRKDPTGSNPGCTNGYGLYDMNGNVWEHVLNGDETRIRGGAYNCSDSETLHRCDYIPGTWRPSARGFRCCSPGSVVED